MRYVREPRGERYLTMSSKKVMQQQAEEQGDVDSEK